VQNFARLSAKGGSAFSSFPGVLDISAAIEREAGRYVMILPIM
jgi:hypothetical protein